MADNSIFGGVDVERKLSFYFNYSITLELFNNYIVI